MAVPPGIQAEIDRLRAEIRHHEHRYYVLDSPEIADAEFDRADAAAAGAGGRAPRAGHRRLAHPARRRRAARGLPGPRPLRARCSAWTTPTPWRKCSEFDARARRLAPGTDFAYSAELKFDGLSMALLYEGGRLERAVTRGDGVRGEVVTPNVRTIRTIPLALADRTPDAAEAGSTRRSATIEVRGEVIMPLAELRGAEPRPQGARRAALRQPAQRRRRHHPHPRPAGGGRAASWISTPGACW